MKIDSKLLGAALIASQAIAGTVLAQTELEVVSWKGAGTEVAEIPTIIKKFEKANPDIKVRLNYMARNDMVTSIPARMQSGDVPDVVMVDNEFILHWGGNGQLEPLNGLPFVERLQPSLLPYSGLDSTIYYAMLEVSGKGVYTNDDLLAKAGIESFPETIDELVVACGKLNDKGILPMLLAANNGGWTPYVYFLAMGLTDGDAPDPDRMEKLTSGELKFAGDPYMKGAFEGFKKLIDAKCFDPRISAGTDPWSVALTSFQAGRVAMLPQGMWNIPTFKKDTLPENFSFYPFPSANSDKAMVMDYNGPGWAIPTAAKDKEAAKRWIDFWMQDENLQIFVTADTGLSTLKGGTSGLPAVAEAYEAARNAGHVVTFPVGRSFPAQLGADMPNDITSFMLNPDQDYTQILERWDQTAAKERQ